MKKIIFALILLLLIAGCVDKTASIGVCEKKGYQFYDTTWSCDIICIDIETQEKHTYDGNCNLNIKYDKGGN
jgi:PBP1b-binding outer membrane lipoprotein LpoB